MERPPAHTAIRYILQGLSPADVENVFRQHAADLNHAGSGLGMHVVAFDGKALKVVSITSTTSRQNRCSARLLSTRLWFWRISRSTKNQRDPGRAETAGRTRRCGPYRHVRCDALSKKTFEAAAAANAHLIVQLKDNQLTLRQKVEAVCDTTTPLSGVRTVMKNAAIATKREPSPCSTQRPPSLDAMEPYVAAVVQVERIVHAFQPATGLWRTSAETSFYLCNCMIDANRAAIAVRMHWGSKISFTTRAMSRYAKMHRAFEKIRASSREFEASPTTFSGSINPTQSRKTATPPLSAVSNPYFL